MKTEMDIETALINLEGKSLFADAVRLSAKTDFYECIRMILDQTKDNRPLVAHIIGEELLTKIEQI